MLTTLARDDDLLANARALPWPSASTGTSRDQGAATSDLSPSAAGTDVTLVDSSI